MRIVFILSGTIMSGGATKSFLNLHRYLKSKGDETIVITPDRNGVYKELDSNGVEVHALKYGFNTISVSKNPILVLRSYISYLRNSIYSYIAFRRLLSVCEKFHPDLIHSNTSVNSIGYLVAKKLQIPHIWHLREYGDLDFGFKVPFLYNKLNQNKNFSICITKGIAKHMKCLNRPNSRVIYNGILSEVELNQKSLIKKEYFLYAGRIEKAKGLIDLIEAYNIYNIRKNGDSLPLKIVGGIGEADYSEIVAQRINQYKLTDKICMVGEVSDIKSYFEKAKAVIVPSYNEGFGRVAAEAMSLGTLVIGRDTAGTKEQFDNGWELTGEEIGLRFNNVEDLANMIYDVAESDDNHYDAMTNRAQQCVEELYSCEKYGKNVRDFYNYILDLSNDKESAL